MVPGSLLTAETNKDRQKDISQVDIYFMASRKKIWFSFVFFLSVLVITFPLSHATLPKNYKGKKIFYDSLSIILNKYIVPVGNWGLFEGTLEGMQSLIGKSQFSFESENNQIILSIKDIPPIFLSTLQ